MVVRGRVFNGVVRLEHGIHLPEGQEVTVLGTAIGGANPATAKAQQHSVLDIPTLNLGSLLCPLSDDDLLGETLEARLVDRR